MIEHRSERAVETGRRATILLVEDDRLIRLALSLELKKCGYEILASDTAEGALELVSADPRRVGAVLTDVQLPGRSGLELVEELRSRGVSVPVLVMSAHPDERVYDYLRAHPEVVWLAKPFEHDELTAQLARMLAAAGGDA